MVWWQNYANAVQLFTNNNLEPHIILEQLKNDLEKHKSNKFF